MARALLINPSYFRTYGSNEGGLAFPVFPVLGLASAGGAARDRGHDVTILDLSYRRYDASVVESALREIRPDVVGITATTPLTNQMRDISYLVADVAPRTITVGGGAHPTALPAETLEQSALDHVIAGEGDFALAALLDGADPASIDGLWHRDADGPVRGTAPRLLDDLDLLPMPAWERYPGECQRHLTRLTARYRPVTTVEFSRGCIYSCDFCGSKNTMGRGYRKKSAERCADEMARLAALGFREAVVVDDIFTSDNEWAAAVCEAIIRKGSPVAWTCTNGIRVDSASGELFELMRRAGCYRVYFGLESGSDDVLRAFGKGGRASVEQARTAIAMARRAGLEPNGFFLVGLTGDTPDSMQATIDFARNVELDTMKCGICVPFPGTPMFEELRTAGRIRTLDWDAYTVYNDADRIFEHPTLEHDEVNRYFRRFYVEAYLRNPRYLLRRLRHAVRSRELVWTAWYTLKFVLMLWRRTPADAETYRYEAHWRPSDLVPSAKLASPVVLRARRGGTGGRDGVVSVVAPRRRRRGETTASAS